MASVFRMMAAVWSARFALWACVAMLVVSGAAMEGCAGRRAAREVRRATRVVPVEDRIDAVVGRTLVIPVKVEGTINPKQPILWRLDDGRRLAASLYWVSMSPEPGEMEEPGEAGTGAGWLPYAGRWSATPASAGSRPSASGSWVVVVDLPLDCIGQGVWLGTERTILNWLPDPAHVMGGANGERVPWRPPLGEGDAPASLLRMADPELHSPVRRWRYKLLLRGLAPEAGESLTRAAAPTPPGPPLPAFDDPVLEALARQYEARWQVALAMLWLADADLAERVKRRLVAAVDFGGGRVAPAWPTNQLEIDTLLHDLLNPRLGPGEHAERASAWLDSLPPAAAWVIDDAGLRDAMTGRGLGTCGVANLGERQTLAWATAGEGAATPDLVPLPPLEARHLAVSMAVPAEGLSARAMGAGAQAAPVTATVHAGRWSAARPIALDPLPATPPGLRVEPLLGDWTMAAWLNGTPSAQMLPQAQRVTAGLVYQRPEESGSAAAGGAGGSAWWLYLECRGPEMEEDRAEGSAAAPATETARVWLGAMGSPSAVLRVSSDGVVLDESAAGRGAAVDGATLTRQRGRWIAQVPIPARCIEPDGTLRIGVERTDARGRRSAWPRPMLPWQAEPGRAAVSTTAWGSIAPTPASATR